MVPQRAWKPVPDLGLFWLWRQTMAMLIFCPQKSEAAFLSLPPTPLWSHRWHCTGHQPQAKTATMQAGVQVSFWAEGSLGHSGTLECGWGVAPPSHIPAHTPPPLSRKTKHTCKAHWVRCTHTPQCVKEQMLSEKEINWCWKNQLYRQRALAYVFVDYFPSSCNPQVFFLHDFRPFLLFPHFAERYFIFLKDLL